MSDKKIKYRKFIANRVGCVKGRVKRDTPICQKASERIIELITDSNILKDAPFEWVGMTYHYTIMNHLKLQYVRIDKKYGEVPVSVSLRMDVLEWADKHNLDLMYEVFMIAALECMLQLCKKYKLSDELFKTERLKFKQIPESVEECIEHYPKNTPWSDLYP